ncbi:MAG: glycosyltransferase family 39 protein, partial [Sinobacteraceae bacterium]|nr:glycosyltransferase family 39 protein [Nevskiaceae bacterium]
MSRPVLIHSGLALLIILSLALAAGTWHTFGHTWDEPEHLAAGLELLDRGRYEYDTEHPPLARLCIALGPWLAGAHSFGTPPPSGVQEGIDILYDGGHYARTLTLARLGALPFLALLLLGMWLWARRVAATDVEALLAVALLASVPPVLGHGALAALDAPGTATTLLALYCLQRWMSSARLSDAVWFALTAGVAVATKFSAIPFVFLGAAGLGGLRMMWRPAGAVSIRPRAAVLGLIVLAAIVPIVFAYGPRSMSFTALPERFTWLLSYVTQDATAREQLRASLLHVRLPE